MGSGTSKGGEESNFDDIGDKPNTDGSPSMTELMDALWEMKDRWTGFREPLVEAKRTFQEAAGCDKPISHCVRGLILCIVNDLIAQGKAGDIKQLSKIIKIIDRPPFLEFNLGLIGKSYLEKYAPLVEAFKQAVIKYGESAAVAADFVSSLSAMPAKISAVIESGPKEFSNLGMGEKLVGGKKLASAVTAAYLCV